MSTSQLKLSLKDIIPTHPEPYPPQLVSFADYLYLLSLQKNPVLPNRAEIARCHFCAYLAAEKYQRSLKLPEPSVRKIPVQPKLIEKFLDDFRVTLLNQERSASASPTTSPTKRRTQRTLNFTTPTSSPSKITKLSPMKHTTPKISSPLKKLQALRDQELKQAGPDSTPASLDINDEESIFNQKEASEASESVPNTPSTPTTKYVKRQITIADFISFANNFFIPASITPKMVESFVSHKHKFTKKNEWLLACGMINAAYVRINHQLLQKTIGAKSQFQNQLFQYQKGGLMRWNMLLWCNIIEDAIKDEPWISEIEQNYIFGKSPLHEDIEKREIDAKLGPGWELFERFGSMSHPNVQFDSGPQNLYHHTWTNNIISQLDS